MLLPRHMQEVRRKASFTVWAVVAATLSGSHAVMLCQVSCCHAVRFQVVR